MRADLITDEQLDRFRMANYAAWQLLDDIQRDCLAEAGEDEAHWRVQIGDRTFKASGVKPPLVVLGQGDYRREWP